MLRFLLSISIILFLSIAAYADYHYASHQGSSTYPYTSWETAADSIQKAIDATSPHDTAYISSGDWYEAVAVEMYDSIAILGMGMDSTRCHYDGNSAHYDIFFIDNGCSVECITFIGDGFAGAIHARVYAGVYINGCKFLRCRYGVIASGYPLCTISNCVFDSCAGPITNFVTQGNHWIRNNILKNNYDPIGGWAIQLNGYSMIIENNIILTDPRALLHRYEIMYCVMVTGGIVRNNVADVGSVGLTTGADQVYNNTVSRMGSFPIDYGIQGAQNQDVFNNAVTDCRTGIYVTGGSSTSVRYNDLWRNSYYDMIGTPGDTIGNLFVDPMFANPDSFDFHLQAYSPLINAGDPAILDVDGTRSDIGCYGGPGGCSYVYLDLAPKIPDSLSASVDSSGIHLIWKNNYEADFNRYQIFRDTVTGFTPSIFNMISEPDIMYFLDINVLPGVSYFYRLTSVDNQGNVSEHSAELAVYPTGMTWDKEGNLKPEYSSIEKAYPNPFNSDVTIVYSASNLGPQPPEVKLVIYDIQGREVRTLVDERKPMGTYRVVWDGKDDSGRDVSSGTYLARLTQWGMGYGDFPVKITLVK